MNKIKILKKLLLKLKGLNWCFISGMAVSVYTNNKRKFGDIDIVLGKKSLDKLAERLGIPAKKTIQHKGKTIIKDYRINFNFLGQKVEAVTNYPNDKTQLKMVKKTLKNRRLMNYLSMKVYVTPLEELIIQKSSMRRNKDINDLKLLKKLKINNKLADDFKKLWTHIG